MRYRSTLTGVVAALVYTGTVILGGAITPGYSHTGEHVSALTQAGAENNPVLVPLFLVYNALTVAMGYVLIEVVRQATSPRRRLGITGGWALVATGVVGAGMLAFPMDPVGAPATTVGVTHIVLAAFGALLTMIAIGLGGAWLLGTARRWAGWYSLVTLGVIFIAGPIAAIATANLDQFMGLYERVPIFGFIQWLFVIGLVLATLPASAPTARLDTRHGRIVIAPTAQR
jgi:hypothetical protein